MNVRVTSSLAGNGFTFGWGQIVDADIFAAKVGAGWERKCEPVDEAAAAVPASEAAAVRPALETATKRRRK
jgi:hypothetical protein